jgi:signal transduction histidine kinase
VARILHIEHEIEAYRTVQELLGGVGHQVRHAPTGLEGIRMAQEEPPDLVLLNFYMPDLDGFEVTLRLKGVAALEAVPIVALTSREDTEKSLAVGCDGFIATPAAAETLVGRVERFLRGHRDRYQGRASRQLRITGHRIVEKLEGKVRELSEANARLEEMARLRREFLRNLSHELATPMTPIVGYLRLLLGEELGPLNPMQKKSLVAVQSSTERLRGLIDTLLDVSGLETGHMHFYSRHYDFGGVTARVVASNRARFAERKVELTVAPYPDDLEGRGDPDKLRRAIAHILDNAIKFTPKRGKVAIEARREGEHFELWVVDSGPGVSTEQLPKIMDAFYQADGSVTRHHGGVGLGLAFARKVTEAMGGGVEVRSPPERAVAGVELRGTQVVLRVKADADETPLRP